PLHHRRPRAAGPRCPARCLRQARAGRSPARPDHHTTAHRERSVSLRPDEIASILKSEIERYEVDVDVEEVGTVIQIGDGIARIYGLMGCVALEKLELPHGVTGLALNLEEDNVAAVLFGEWEKVAEGDTVKRTGQVMSVPVGDALIGRVVDPLGVAIDGGPPIETSETRPLELKAPSRVCPQPGKTPPHT